MEGWIKLWRRLLKHIIWKKSTPEQKVILITLLCMANHESSEWEWRGEEFKVGAGQFITSLDSIRDIAGKGISIQNIRTALKKFKSKPFSFLTYKPTSTGRLITILNWDTWQGDDEKLTRELTGNQQRGNKDLTPNKNDKNNKKRKELELPDFINLEIWKAFKAHRVQIKRRMTPHAERLVINKLIKFKEGGHDPNAIIELSIENGWISVFEPKQEASPSTTPSEFYKPPEDESDPEKTVANLQKLRETIGDVGDKGIE